MDDLLLWYTRGGFIDEYGRKHISEYEYNWDYTEIFKEIKYEYHMSIECYTCAHDAVIQGIRRHTNNYDMKYVGLAFANHNQFAAFRYFLNHSNHLPNIPLDMVSNHFYATSGIRTNPSDWSIY